MDVITNLRSLSAKIHELQNPCTHGRKNGLARSNNGDLPSTENAVSAQNCRSIPVEDLSAEISDLKDSIRSLQFQLSKVQEDNQRELKSLRMDVSELTTSLRSLSMENHQLQAQLNQQLQGDLPSSAQLTKTMDPVKQRENVAELKSFGVQEILCLLKIMNLSQYSDVFMEEGIDGEILAECTDVLLEKELQITNKIHRNRLLKVISGRHSALNLRHGLDPYAGMIVRTDV